MERFQEQTVNSAIVYIYARIIYFVGWIIGVNKYSYFIDALQVIYEFPPSKRLALLIELKLIRMRVKCGSRRKKFFLMLLTKFFKRKFGGVLSTTTKTEREKVFKQIIKAERYNEHNTTYQRRKNFEDRRERSQYYGYSRLRPN